MQKQNFKNYLLTGVKSWALPIAMLSGALSYILLSSFQLNDVCKSFMLNVVEVIQPMLIFMMLFVSFCKVGGQRFSLLQWHIWALLFQALGFIALGWVVLKVAPDESWRSVIEGGMLCMICPTATAAVVIVSKLGASPEGVATYTLLSNLLAAVLVPVAGAALNTLLAADFLSCFAVMLSKVLPLLVLPLFLAMFVRRYLAGLMRVISRQKDLAFYLWLIALSLAIALTTRSLLHSGAALWMLLGLGAISFVCCALQFAIGKILGHHFDDPVNATQGLGQKNTVFAMWLGFTFFTPISALAGGFYSIWHNLYNSWQLYHHCKRQV